LHVLQSASFRKRRGMPPTSESSREMHSRDRLGGGEGGIRTLGPPQRGQRFSRPPRSTAPAPLHPNGGEGLARGREEQQGNAVHSPASGAGGSIVFAVAPPNLAADLARGKFCRVDVGIGGIGVERVDDGAEVTGGHILCRR